MLLLKTGGGMRGSETGPSLLSKNAVIPRFAVYTNRRVSLVEIFRRNSKQGADRLASI